MSRRRRTGWPLHLAGRSRLRALLWIAVACGAVLFLVLALRLLRGALQRDPTWARIQHDRVLRVGMDASFPPFGVVDEQGGFSGLDVDLATALAERWGVQARFSNVGFDGLYDALKIGKFDLIISALPYDRTMTRDLLYSPSYFNAGQVLLARSDDQRLRSFDDLEGKVVAVELGSEAHQLVRRLARDKGMRPEVSAQREAEQAVALLRQGQADALVCDRVTAYGYMRGTDDLCLVGEPLTDEPYVIAARPDSPLLMEQVTEALDEWRGNGMLEEMLGRWF